MMPADICRPNPSCFGCDGTGITYPAFGAAECGCKYACENCDGAIHWPGDSPHQPLEPGPEDVTWRMKAGE